jgi:hypothetical protein
VPFVNRLDVGLSLESNGEVRSDAGKTLAQFTPGSACRLAPAAVMPQGAEWERRHAPIERFGQGCTRMGHRFEPEAAALFLWGWQSRRLDDGGYCGE